MKPIRPFAIVSLFTTLLGGCASFTPDSYTGRPDQLPLPNRSDATPLLECLGWMLESTPGPELDVIVGPLPDATLPAANPYGGFLSYGGQMIGRTSLALLGPRIGVLGESYDPRRPTVVLRGEFTELDRVTPSRGMAGTLRLGSVEIELNDDRSYDFIGLDLELARVDMRQIPGMATRLSVIVDSRTRDATVLWDNDKGGQAASAAVQFKAVGRRHGAQRLLIETGIFLLLSRYLGLETRACLDYPPADVTQARRLVHKWREMKKAERTRAVQRLLNAKGARLSVDGRLGSGTRRAIKTWQLARHEPPTGQLTAQLYVALHDALPGEAQASASTAPGP